MKLILIGFMGSGKTTISQLYGSLFQQPVFDLDAEVVQAANASIPEIFAQHGEHYFRDLEHQVLAKTIRRDGILATGGGTPIRDDNAQLLIDNAAPVVWLQADTPTTLQRIREQAGDRPIGDRLNEHGVDNLQQQRHAAYARCADMTIDTDGLTPQQIVEQIHRSLAVK